ncbi:MAG: esterase, partial [Microlunatus sp.]|nr:esterase [Microlunatus sp.]
MRREQLETPLGSGIDRGMTIVSYGHYGRPVLVFPPEAGRAWDFENNGMVAAVADLIDDGRVKLYCVDALDTDSWANQSLPIEQRALRHEVYTRWLTHTVVPHIHDDTTPGAELITTGCGMGAYHAVHFAFQRADLAPMAIGLSGNYDATSWHSWGERGEATYFANPVDYVPNLHGDHLEWLRQQLSILLVVGQGAWETHPTGSLPSTVRFAQMLQEKGIRCELD